MLVPPKYIIKAKIGIVATIVKAISESPDKNFPVTIDMGDIFVTKRRSRVCLSLSPLILPAVKAGVISNTSTNCKTVRPI